MQHKMQQSPRHEAIEGAGQARVQTVSRAVAAAAGVGVHAQREGGDVQEETVFALLLGMRSACARQRRTPGTARSCNCKETVQRLLLSLLTLLPPKSFCSSQPAWKLL